MWVWWRWKFPDGATLSTFPLYCLCSPIPPLKWRTSQLRHFEICLIICLYLYHMSYLFLVWNEECSRYWSFLQYHLVLDMEQEVFSQVQQFVDGKEYHSMSTAFCVSESTSALFLLSPSFSVFAPPRSPFPLSNTHVFFQLYPLPALNIMTRKYCHDAISFIWLLENMFAEFQAA